MAITTYVKDPSAVLDYKWDWTAWLDLSETIASYTVTIATGLTKVSDSQAAGKVTVWLSGGTAGSVYTAVCRIVTSAARTDERTFRISVLDR